MDCLFSQFVIEDLLNFLEKRPFRGLPFSGIDSKSQSLKTSFEASNAKSGVDNFCVLFNFSCFFRVSADSHNPLSQPFPDINKTDV